MFHIVLSIASRFMFFGNVLQGLARGILALRNLGIISSHLIPTLSPPPPILLLDAAAPFVELPEEIHSPYPSAGLIAIERIERRTPAFSSPIPSYQSSLISVTPSHLPDFLPLLITLAIISGLVVFFPGILYFFVKVVKIPSTFTHASRYISKFFGFKPISGFLPARLPLRFTSRLLVSLVSLLLLWTGPVRTMALHHCNANNISSPPLRPSSPSSGSCPSFCLKTRARTWCVCSRGILDEPMSYSSDLDCRYLAVVRDIGHAGHPDAPYPECDLRAG